MRRVYKSGRVRLTGKDLTDLRRERWELDCETCQKCLRETYWEPRFAGDPDAYDMAHKVSRGAGGSDVLENVRTLCHRCHMAEHAGKLSAHGKGIKPV